MLQKIMLHSKALDDLNKSCLRIYLSKPVSKSLFIK